MHLLHKEIILAVALCVPASRLGAQTQPVAAACRRLEATAMNSNPRNTQILRELDQAMDELNRLALYFVLAGVRFSILRHTFNFLEMEP